MKEYIKSAKLISKHLLNRLPKEEQKQLKSALEDDINKQAYLSIKNNNQIEQRLNQRKKLDIDSAYNRFIEASERNRFKLSHIAIKYAAIASILLLIGLVIHHLSNVVTNELPTLANVTIQPGESKAILVLGNGAKINLDDDDNTSSLNVNGARISNSNNCLKYRNKTNNLSQTEYNTIITPKGGEYQLHLSDGTKVWLNADSELTYPVSFNGTNRIVKLRGEAFFEVAHNPDQPFIVQTQEQQTKVLGTSFNVSAYPGDKETVTTLVNGSIEARLNNINFIKTLLPNEQLIVNLQNLQTQTRQVDSYIYSAWKDGRFVYRNKELGEILEDMERWYNFKVTYDCETTKNYNFSIDIKKYDSFEKVIKLLELTGTIDLEVNGNILLAKSIV